MIEVTTPEQLGLSSVRLLKLTDWLDQQVSRGRLAGASVLVGRRGKVGYVGTAGVTDLDSGDPFGENAVVRAYSMTKPIVTVAAMMLYEDGCFQLDDPVSKYLPEFSETPVWVGGQSVT